MFTFTLNLNTRSISEVLFFIFRIQTMTEQKEMYRFFSIVIFLHHLFFLHFANQNTHAPVSSPFSPIPILSISFLAGSRLQHGLELSRHAYVFLLLAHNTLDGGRQAAGVPGEDQGVAVLAAAVLLQCAAGVGDGVVVIVGVDHPVVVAWPDRQRERGSKVKFEMHNCVSVCVCVL